MITQPIAKGYITIYVSEPGEQGPQGEPGSDGEFLDFQALTEKAIVYIDSEHPNGCLAIQLQYNILHVKGATTEAVSASSSGYHIRFRTNVSSTYYYLSNNVTNPNYTNVNFLPNYHTASSKPEWLIVELCNGSSHTVLKQKIVGVIYRTELLFDINEELNQITSVVQGHEVAIGNLQNQEFGNRNYVRNTSGEWSDWIPLSNINNQTVNCGDCYLPANKNVGDYFTSQITIQWSSVEASNDGTFRISAQTPVDGNWGIPSFWNNELVYITTEPEDNVVKYVHTYQVQETNKDAILMKAAFRIDYALGSFRYKCVQIEKGNVATDWNPNPDDFENSITTITNNMSNITQTMNQISSTVSSHTTSINGLTDDVSVNKSNISNLTQRADSIESTVEEHNYMIDWALGDPDNLYRSTSYDGGVLNFGDGWINKWQLSSTIEYSCENFTKYNTPIYVGKTQWYNFDSGTSYLYAPYLYMISGRTYTLNCYFESPDDSILQIELCRYINSTDAINLATPITTTIIRGNQSLDHDSDVLQFTIPTSGYYRIRFCNISNNYAEGNDYDVELFYPRLYAGAKSIDDICPWNDLFASSFSKIQQTANDITLQVNNISLILDGIQNNITLNGDTIINGYLVLNDSSTGFILNSMNGTIQISPENIGSYSDFSSKTENEILVFQSKTNVPQQRVDGKWNLTSEFVYDLGQFNSGTLIKLTNYIVSFMQNQVGTSLNVITPSSVSVQYKIYEGTTLKTTINISSQTQSSITNYTTTSTDNLQIKINIAAVFNADSISTEMGTLKEQYLIRTTSSYKVTKPTTVFGMLSPNGIGYNFSNLSHFYAGPEGTIIKYNNYGLKIDSTGIYKMINGSTWTSL